MIAKIVFTKNRFDQYHVIDFRVLNENNETDVTGTDILTDIVYECGFDLMVVLIRHEEKEEVKRVTWETGMYILESKVVVEVDYGEIDLFVDSFVVNKITELDYNI